MSDLFTQEFSRAHDYAAAAVETARQLDAEQKASVLALAAIAHALNAVAVAIEANTRQRPS